MAYDDQTMCSKGGFDAFAQKSDTVDLTIPARAFYANGTWKVTTIDGSVVASTTWGGGIVPLQIKRLWSTGTGSTEVIGFY